MATQDVGGGLQMVDFAGSQGTSALDQYQKVLSITDLANRIQMAPAQRQAQELENKLKEAQVAMVPLQQQRAQFEFEAAQSGERRAQATAYFGHLNEVTNAFKQDFSQGEYALANVVPGAQAKKLEDGSVSIVAPKPGGGVQTFRLFPNKTTANPEAVQQGEQNLRQQWVNSGKLFQEVDQNLRTIKLASANPSGPGDLAIIVGMAKILDPGSVVREGDVEMIKNTTNLPSYLVAAYRQQMKDPRAASLDPGLRKMIVETAELKVRPMRDDLRNMAQGMAATWDNAGYDPKKIFVPIGSLTQAEMFGTPEKKSGGGGAGGKQEIPHGEIKQGRRSAAKEPAPKAAEAAPVSAAQEAPAQAAPPPQTYDLRQMTGGALQKMQGGGTKPAPKEPPKPAPRAPSAVPPKKKKPGELEEAATATGNFFSDFASTLKNSVKIPGGL